MELETLEKANVAASELRGWQDIELRLNLEMGFRVVFNAYKTKTLHNEYDRVIVDKDTINAYKKFVKSMIKKYEDEIKKL